MSSFTKVATQEAKLEPGWLDKDLEAAHQRIAEGFSGVVKPAEEGVFDALVEDDDFGHRLPRTPYLVVPKLALLAMPLEWRRQFSRLLQIADDAGMETPDYQVLLNGAELQTDENGERVTDMPDPWANYRYGKIASLNPTFDFDKAQTLTTALLGQAKQP